jgi:hypothetical protein
VTTVIYLIKVRLLWKQDFVSLPLSVSQTPYTYIGFNTASLSYNCRPNVQFVVNCDVPCSDKMVRHVGELKSADFECLIRIVLCLKLPGSKTL